MTSIFGWTLQLFGFGNNQFRLGPDSIWYSSRFGFDSLALPTLRCWYWCALIFQRCAKPAACRWSLDICALHTPCSNEVRSHYAAENGCPCRLDVRLNVQNTQFILMGTRQQLANLNLDALPAEFPTMFFYSVVRDLGVLLDSKFTFSPDIDQVCRSCYCHSK